MSNSSDAKMKQMLSELRAGFVDELPWRMDEIELLVLNIEKPGNFAEVYRHIHSIKGSAGTHGIASIAAICHQFEDLLSKHHQDNGQDRTGIYLKYIDFIRQVIPEVRHNAVDEEALRQGLGRLLKEAYGRVYKVLVVDSSKSLPEMIEQSLHDYPLHLTHINNGFHALEKLLLQKYDLLITSRELPMLNGIALIAANQHAHVKNSHIPIILITNRRDDTEQLPENVTIYDKDSQLIGRIHNFIERMLK